MGLSKVVIFGNSGAGKSTLAQQLVKQQGLAHLDLDTLAWEPGMPPVRKNRMESQQQIEQFVASHSRWVIEGCYADLLGMAIEHANEVVFLNPGIELCLRNAQNRPWEPHKYANEEDQHANLPMLLDWIRQYEARDDEFSLMAHQLLFERFSGKKAELTARSEFYL